MHRRTLGTVVGTILLGITLSSCDKPETIQTSTPTVSPILQAEEVTATSNPLATAATPPATSTVIPTATSTITPGRTATPPVNQELTELYHETLEAYMYHKVVIFSSIEEQEVALVPWYVASNTCTVDALRENDDFTADREHYLMVSDEFSKVFVEVSLSNNNELINALLNTVELIPSDAYGPLPSWMMEIQGDSITKLNDHATDASARIGLGLEHIIANDTLDDQVRSRAAEMAPVYREAFLEHSFVVLEQPLTSPVTGHPIYNVITGGGNTSMHGLPADMWIGYFPDVIQYMVAAAANEPSRAEEYMDIALQVTDQFLIASYQQGGLFAPNNFTWVNNRGQLGIQKKDAYFWNEISWDTHDAPRALAMGNVLRVFDLYYSERPDFEEISKLEEWVQDVQEIQMEYGPACVQLDNEVLVVQGNCYGPESGKATYGFGLVAQLFATSPEFEKFTRTAIRSLVNGVPQGYECPGTYEARHMAPLAALAGLDAHTYQR